MTKTQASPMTLAMTCCEPRLILTTEISLETLASPKTVHFAQRTPLHTFRLHEPVDMQNSRNHSEADQQGINSTHWAHQ
ncbi:hypothetical protein [Paenarthrobacter aurescens]|nr:hypothetical protein [Paenarthrobacter aurescens]MDO6144864.1 hypothetical protein [Paenarthrobacter aurescens]MDO6148709.1 hypothetical protein [Paenarthrobacter aurescens]MDO6159955.1 hypothetical protein [Paenarthrobacter aurescens]MDO6163814.1 hypothetical protein [Paenarthrobacter aurescens]